MLDGKYISIHTPTRGVTTHNIGSVSACHDFNPHSHKGSDGYGLAQWTYHTNFNPHSHKGSDQRLRRGIGTYHDFNPHSHKGSDPHDRLTVSGVEDFNPHSHKGSDLAELDRKLEGERISIHTPTREMTMATIHCTLTNLFQSTLPQGE